MREKLREARKKKILKVLIITGAVLLLACLVYLRFALPRWFGTMQMFRIANIVVEPASYHDFVVGYLALGPDANMLTLDMASLYEKLRKVYFIESCIIEKHLPDTLEVRLKVRNPWVALASDDHLQLMDRQGYFLPYEDGFSGWIVEGIASGEPGERSKEDDKIRILGEIEKWYNYFGIGNFFPVTKVSLTDIEKIELSGENATIYLHPDGLERRFEKIRTVLDTFTRNRISFEYIDMRFDAPYVKRREETITETEKKKSK
jgi:cell division septal protein FtsQ